MESVVISKMPMGMQK